MKKQEEHAANHIAHALKEIEQANTATSEEISSVPVQVDADQEEAPPKTGSKQWKAFYQRVSEYAKELRESRK
ncbi:hypothetical protein [Paenibacillus sp. FSL W7-1287]|uniref:hypothetical protein n=1 Tax=Paenibacillus sp. FSL W7-1287 TaxID=2954538 RepID=UPI0030FC1632